MQNHLLIIEDDLSFGSLLEDKFQNIGWSVTRVVSVNDAKNILQDGFSFSHCLLDLNLSHQSGLSLLPYILERCPACKVVVLTGYASVHTTIEAIKLGAVYLLSKPSGMSDILKAFDHCSASEDIRLDAYAKSGMEQKEWEMIQLALVENQFNISKTAEQLGLHRRTLQRKLRKKG